MHFTHLLTDAARKASTHIHANFRPRMWNKNAFTFKKNAYCVFISQAITCLKLSKLQKPHIWSSPVFPLCVTVNILYTHTHTRFPNSHFVKQGADSTVTQVSLSNVWISSGTVLYVFWFDSHIHLPTFRSFVSVNSTVRCVLCNVLLIKHWLTLLMFGSNQPFSDLWLR